MSVLNVLRGGLAAAAIVGFATSASAVGSKSLIAGSAMEPSVVYADDKKKCPEGQEWSEETNKCEMKKEG